jgi:hypothetical protein
LERNISAVKRVEFVGNKMLCIVVRGCWNDAVVPNAYLPMVDERGGACGS